MIKQDRKPGAGRPRLEAGNQKRRNVTLSDETVEQLRAIGDGNISEGIRRAAAAFNKTRN